MIIDSLAYASRLRTIAAVQKLIFSAAAMIICIAANSFAISALTAAVMLFMIIRVGGTRAKNVFKLMCIPVIFIAASAAAIVVSIGSDSSAMICAVKIGGAYLGVSASGIAAAARTSAKALGAVSCMYFLSLTTPMTDLFSLLRKSPLPDFIAEIAELIYRYIFVLFDAAERIRIAQETRLGYATLKTSYRSTAQLASNLFMRAFRQADRTYTALASRGYEGEINVISERQKISARFCVFSAAYILTVTAAALFAGKAGI